MLAVPLLGFFLALAQIGGFTNEELHRIFAEWNSGELESFLIEITANIFMKKDDLTPDGYLLDKILDKTGMKGEPYFRVCYCQ